MNPNAAIQPMPPLPEMQTGPSGGGMGGDPNSAMAAILSGIAPVKAAVDAIRSACQQIVQSGAVPGSEQICGQIVSLSSQLVPMAAQQALQPMGGGGGMGGGLPMPPPPGGPAPMMG